MKYLYLLTPWVLSLAMWAVIILIAVALFGGSPTDLADHCYDRCP